VPTVKTMSSILIVKLFYDADEEELGEEMSNQIFNH